MIALATGFMGIGSFRRLGLISVNRLNRRIQIEDERGRQARLNHIAIQLTKLLANLRVPFTQVGEFFVQQGMVRTTSSEKTSNQGILLEPAEMKEPLATEDPADEKVKDDLMNREKGISCLLG
ncbi:hypothetical protein D3C81_1540900 [compost metagenome]